jgi:hypothetical protein
MGAGSSSERALRHEAERQVYSVQRIMAAPMRLSSAVPGTKNFDAQAKEAKDTPLDRPAAAAAEE